MKKKIVLVALLFIMLGAMGRLIAQEIKAVASLDTVTMLIGQQRKYTLELTQPSNAKVVFPVLSDTLCSKVVIVSQGKIDTGKLGNNMLLLSKQYTITSFDSGYYYIPEAKFEVIQPAGNPSLNTNALALVVQTFPVDTTKSIFDIKEPMAVPYSFKEFLPIILIAVFIILLIVGGFFIYKRMKQNKPLFNIFSEKPKEPAHVIALRELDRIKEEKLWLSSREKEFYTQLTDTLRTFIEDRFAVAAPEMTSSEILDALKGFKDLTPETYNLLSQTLKLSDLVKFAKFTPLMDEHDRSLSNAFNFVNKNIKVEVVEIPDGIAESEKSVLKTDSKEFNA